MSEFIVGILISCWIVLVIYLLYEGYKFHFKTPNIIFEKYGKPIYSFWTSILFSIFKNNLCFTIGSKCAATTSPAFIAIYQDFIICKCSKFEIKINREDIIEFNEPTFFKNCSLKIKTHDVYKSETLEFVFISKKKIKFIQDFLR